MIVGGELRAALGWFLREYEVEVAIIQNALALPVNVPLGVALAEVLVETGLPAIGHHHDFAWERERFRHPQLPRLLHSVFPRPAGAVAPGDQHHRRAAPARPSRDRGCRAA